MDPEVSAVQQAEDWNTEGWPKTNDEIQNTRIDALMLTSADI